MGWKDTSTPWNQLGLGLEDKPKVLEALGLVLVSKTLENYIIFAHVSLVICLEFGSVFLGGSDFGSSMFGFWNMNHKGLVGSKAFLVK